MSAAASLSIAHTVGEFFTLSTLETRVSKLSGESRNALVRNLRLGRQKQDAAETLWKNGHPAEGLCLMLEAFRAMERAASILSQTGLSPEGSALADTLKALHSPSAAKRVNAAEQASVNLVLPVLKEAVRRSDKTHFQTLLDGCVAIEMVCAPLARTSKQIRWRRFVRRAMLALAATAGIAVAIWSVIPKYAVEAVGSAWWASGQDFQPSNVLDGNEETEWLAPDTSPAWIEIQLTPPRSVKGIRILNAHNRNVNDRATRDFRVELRSKNRIVQAVDDTFRDFSAAPEWRLIRVHGTKIDNVRIEVKTWHIHGAGLAEVQVLEP